MSYIKLNRSLLESHSFANPNHLKIWIWMLLKANFKNAFVPINIGRGFITIEVKRGQLIFGRFKAEEELNINGNMIYRTIKQFEELGQIKVEVNSHFSLITICKYDSYQGQINESEQAMNTLRTGNEQHVNNTRTTHEQHMNIYKEELEELEEIEEIEELIIKGKKFLNSDFQDLPEHFYKSIIEQMFILKQKRIEEDTIFKLWDAFKLEKLTGVKWYNSEDEVYKHFCNWIKSQKFIEGDKTNSQKREEIMYDYIKRNSENLGF